MDIGRASSAPRARAAALAGLVAALLVAGLAAAEPPRDGEPRFKGPPGGLVQRHAERLGLSGQALADIEQIVRDSGLRDQALRRQIDAARERMRALLDANADAVSVLAQAEALGALESESRKNRLSAVMEIRTHLTPGQRAEVQRIREEELAAERAGASSDSGACALDLRASCAGADTPERRLGCLQARWSNLGDGCRSALEHLF